MILATIAGFAKLKPMPPNSCLTITIAKNAPTTTTHRGSDGGQLNAISIPVTTADQSPIVIGCFSIFSYRYSKPTHAATETAVRIRELIPKNTTAAASAGSIAMQTSRMIEAVVSLLVICGADDTVSFIS